MTDCDTRTSLDAWLADSLASSDDWLGISFWELRDGPNEKSAGRDLIRESLHLLKAALAILGPVANVRVFPYVEYCLPPTDSLQMWRDELLDLPGWGDNSLNLSKDGQPFFWGVTERYTRRARCATIDATEFFALYTSYTGSAWEGYENSLFIVPDFWNDDSLD